MGAKTEKWVTVLAKRDLEPGAATGVSVEGRDIAVYNVDGRFFATDDLCPHAFARLSEGTLEGTLIECPLHAGQIDVTTGKAASPPIERDVRSFPVRLSGDDVQIDLGL